jgi:hypothetical protein
MTEFLMPLRSLFEYMDALPSSIALRESQYAWAWVLLVHTMSMCLFAGTVAMMDLRLLGIGSMGTPFSQVQRRLFPWQMAGMAVSVVTGAALVYAKPLTYYANIYFWIKMIMMVVAGVNAQVFHYLTYRSIGDWDAGVVPPAGARLAGALGMVLWFSVIFAGRLIPYNWFQ